MSKKFVEKIHFDIVLATAKEVIDNTNFNNKETKLKSLESLSNMVRYLESHSPPTFCIERETLISSKFKECN